MTAPTPETTPTRDEAAERFARYPACPIALERCIIDVDAWLNDSIPLCEIENPISFGESVGLIVHELKRLKALASAPAPAEMPGVEERLRRILAEARIEPEPEASDFAVENIKALFAPILAEKERTETLPYRIDEPEGGWRSHGSFSREEKAKLRPIAETLAMLDGNAFFGNEGSAGAEWYEQYLPEAHALYEGNGGDSGWAGEASFAKPEARALAAEAALAAERERVDQLHATIRKAHVAMTMACALPGVASEYDFSEAIASTEAALARRAAAIRAEGPG